MIKNVQDYVVFLIKNCLFLGISHLLSARNTHATFAEKPQWKIFKGTLVKLEIMLTVPVST